MAWGVVAGVRVVMCVIDGATKKSGIRGGGSFNRTPFWTMGSCPELVASYFVLYFHQG